MTVEETAQYFRVNGCRLNMAKIIQQIKECKTFVVPAAEQLTPTQFNQLVAYLQSAKPILEQQLHEIPTEVNA